MVRVFGDGMVVHFNRKELGLCAVIPGTIFGQSGLDLWTFFGWFRVELFCLFWAFPR